MKYHVIVFPIYKSLILGTPMCGKESTGHQQREEPSDLRSLPSMLAFIKLRVFQSSLLDQTAKGVKQLQMLPMINYVYMLI